MLYDSKEKMTINSRKRMEKILCREFLRSKAYEKKARWPFIEFKICKTYKKILKIEQKMWVLFLDIDFSTE